MGRLRGDLDHRRRDELLDRFELDPTKKGRTYSKGNRQKVALVAALASRAELLILDEPTSGLDPLMESVFQDCFREATAEGCTVLLSSHILAEVEALCDRVSIIRAGRMVQSSTLSELRTLTRTSISAQTDRPPTGPVALAGVTDVHLDDHRVTFSVEGNHLEAAVRLLVDHGLTGLTSQPPTLEELFLRQYSDVPAEERSRSDGDRVTATGSPRAAESTP